MKLTLKDCIGEELTVQNVANDIGAYEKLHFQFNGTLEAPEEDGGTCYLRVKDCYQGASGINFRESDVDGIERMPSKRIFITLK